MTVHSPHGATRPTLSGGAASAAAALLFASGLLTFAVGVSAVAAIDLEVSGRGFEYTFHVTGWGWVNIVAGIVLALAAVGLFSTTAWARPVAVRSYARGHHIHVPVDAVLPRVVGGAGYRGRRDMHGVRHDTRRPERRLLAPAALREHLALRGLALPFVSQIQPTGSSCWAVRAAWLAASCSGDGPSVVGAGFAEDVVNVQLVTADATGPEDSVISVHTDDVEGAYEAPFLRPRAGRQRSQHRVPPRRRLRRAPHGSFDVRRGPLAVAESGEPPR